MAREITYHPLMQRKRFPADVKPLKAGLRQPTLGGMHLDNSALQADHNRMGPIASAELRE